MAKELPRGIRQLIDNTIDESSKKDICILIHYITTEVTENGGYKRNDIIELLQDIMNELD